MYASISDFLFRFNTYVALLDNRGEEFDSNVWFEFSTCDLIEEVIISLQKVYLCLFFVIVVITGFILVQTSRKCDYLQSFG